MPGIGRLALGTGVLTRTVDEQIFLLGLLLGSVDYHRTLCPRSVPLPLGSIDAALMEKIGGGGGGARTLRIGYFVDDGFVKATPGLVPYYFCVFQTHKFIFERTQISVVN